MRIFFGLLFFVHLSVGCVTSQEKANGSESMIVPDKFDGEARGLLGRCRMFGMKMGLLDCVLQTPDGGNMHGILEVGVLKAGENMLSRILDDRRVSGEKQYIVELDSLREAGRSGNTAKRGLPGQLNGRVYRGEPRSGGTLLMKGVSVRIERELHWNQSQAPKSDTLFFALDEGPWLWAVPLDTDPAAWSRIMTLRLLGRLRTKDLESLRRGTVIHVTSTPDVRQIRFGFHTRMDQRVSADPQAPLYKAEIIEE
jgi:hypothetical protein